jgi:hypothetical protein
LYRENAMVQVTGHEGGPVQIEGYTSPTASGLLRFAAEHGILEAVSLPLLDMFRRVNAEVIDGEAVEDELAAPAGGRAGGLLTIL